MQPNPQERTNKKRLRVDAFASKVVTLFGLTVLAMFMLLILHILKNAFPLLQTPTLSLKQDYFLSVPSSLRSIQQMGDEVVGLSFSQCKVVLYALAPFSNGANPSLINAYSEGMQEQASFNHSCGAAFIDMPGDTDYLADYAMLREDGLVELYSINNLSGALERNLRASFNLPIDKFANSMDAVKSLSWQMHRYNNNIVLQASDPQGKHVVIWHSLNRLVEPEVLLIEDADYIKVLPRFAQVLVVNDGAYSLRDKAGEILQTLPKVQANTRGEEGASPANTAKPIILLSPSQRTVYIWSEQNGARLWRSSNIDGRFLLSEVSPIEDAEDAAILEWAFDRQTMVAIARTADDSLRIFNSATNEVVNQHSLVRSESASSEHASSAQKMHWHNQALYVVYEDKLSVYQLKNPAGITTWKSLFEQVQYSGYQSAQYIWQTSQSAEFAQAKYSLIPLIIGSLKAAVLALFVAIPLSLGAAIYTAYFASARVRSRVKPSIEMIEAIPSVIIGFVAAVWLAPFAERSLFALLALVISLPFVIFALAALHSWVKQTDIYLKIQPFYLVMSASTFLVLMLGVFHGFTALQSVLDSSAMGSSDGILSDLTLSKTTVVVALALGVAVAPTIYSLVDDALYEVPDGVKQAAFALGATELQTLLKVVLVVALPSIISAIMLGLGRAFGETMIVLMVTGNTPIADWDLLSGLRSLTSNLTIELQESSSATAHYHILFLTAAILFAFTFFINTVASLMKQRLQGDKRV
ncbi:ABC transporter permease subunit [Glaciecola siphonariae]|uniref:ABC transporter permease subunit n=1 Tax=Glaciecola siphonariae TaxID=521012 RepID=A0ABV9LXB0_9ALTE